MQTRMDNLPRKNPTNRGGRKAGLAVALTVLKTVLLGGIGGATLGFTGLPAGPIVGSGIAVAAAAILGFRVSTNVVLQNVGFAIVGISIGTSMSAGGGDMFVWSLSILFLIMSVITIFFVGRFLLVTFLNFDRHTAVLCALPGALGQSVEVAITQRADVPAVITCQCTRLITMVLFVSVMTAAAGFSPIASGQTQYLSWPLSLLLLLISIVIGFVAMHCRVPAAYIIAGMLVGGALRLSGLVSGVPPDVLVFFGFVLIGCTVGVGFSAISRAELVSHSVAALVLIAAASAISAAFAAVTGAIVGVPFFQVWLAFAPGGAETMAAIALSIQVDPTYVAVHHIIRIFFLSLVVVLLFRNPARRACQRKIR